MTAVAGISAVVGITVVAASTAVAGVTAFDGVPAVENIVKVLDYRESPILNQLSVAWRAGTTTLFLLGS